MIINTGIKTLIMSFFDAIAMFAISRHLKKKGERLEFERQQYLNNLIENFDNDIDSSIYHDDDDDDEKIVEDVPRMPASLIDYSGETDIDFIKSLIKNYESEKKRHKPGSEDYERLTIELYWLNIRKTELDDMENQTIV